MRTTKTPAFRSPANISKHSGGKTDEDLATLARFHEPLPPHMPAVSASAEREEIDICSLRASKAPCPELRKAEKVKTPQTLSGKTETLTPSSPAFDEHWFLHDLALLRKFGVFFGLFGNLNRTPGTFFFGGKSEEKVEIARTSWHQETRRTLSFLAGFNGQHPGLHEITFPLTRCPHFGNFATAACRYHANCKVARLSWNVHY